MDFQRKLHHTPILRQTMQDFVQSKKALFQFGSRNGCVVGGCRPAKGYIKKWVHESANGQPELSTAEEVNVKNMEAFL